jgi:protein-export membrane protein SecD
MTRKNIITFVIILIIFAFALWAILPLEGERLGRKGLHLGLDLVGGVHLVYQADFPEDATGEEQKLDMDRALTTIERRIDKYGVTDPIIQKLGEDRILVQLPGFTDIQDAKSLVEQTGYLEFREVELNEEGQPVYLGDYLESAQTQFFDRGEAADRIFVKDYLSPGEEGYGSFIASLVKTDTGIELVDSEGNHIDKEALAPEESLALSWIEARGDDGTALTGGLLADAVATLSQEIAPKPEINIEWDSEGSVIFDQIAKRLYNPVETYSPEHALGIFLDDTLLSAPQVRAQAFHGRGVITGNFTREKAVEMANLLKSGALPMPLKKPPLYQEKVSATLGADFIEMSWMAGLIGIILVMLFMIAYYRMSGFLASLALIFYGALVLALFKLFPVTLSLAGIGGFILSIGMAVDANVLIFERMKEELRMGRTLGAAIETGFNRAWSAIRDSNVTTIIVCIILYWLGSSIVASAPVMGFALTLLIGVVVSMFTAIVVTRTLLRLFVGTPLARKTMLFSVDWGKK